MSSPSSSPVCRVYVASPLGFSAPGRIFNRNVLVPALEDEGFEVFDPWSVTVENPDGPTIGAKNHRGIDDSQAMLCWLEGQELDSGTCAEVGYGAAQGLFVVGVRDDMRITGEGLGVVNLQVEYFVNMTGGKIVNDLAAAIELLTTWRAGQTA